MRFMGGGQLPLEPFVANKHLILNPTTTPRAADQARESLPATKPMDEYQAGIQQPGLLHSTSRSVRQMLAPSPSPTVNRLCASGKYRHCPHAGARFLVKRRPAEVEGKLATCRCRSETRPRRGRRDHRRRISPCRFGSPLDVGIDRPASGVGEPLRPLPVSRAANLSAPPVPVGSCVFFSTN